MQRKLNNGWIVEGVEEAISELNGRFLFCLDIEAYDIDSHNISWCGEEGWLYFNAALQTKSGEWSEGNLENELLQNHFPMARFCVFGHPYWLFEIKRDIMEKEFGHLTWQQAWKIIKTALMDCGLEPDPNHILETEDDVNAPEITKDAFLRLIGVEE